ncbi:hypothetical protein SAMN05444420_101264 [Capnocytophaga granulosa]|jgi:hypothetical protein|uniref:Uncharacterized protein n=1 Tax=Capnocytophaga granulosa TaxID=45242 RepID=A0A1H2QUU5_9FLAO|nr:hypothetical protein [Capnocytophaga granulosa]EPD29847.1 hypothetical protein HMPREF9331_00478 [Capnocytophaga granulosa ATCC 51502]SDW10952.1 hypothetical protein SAMN05444420_101264 [Capnocytophaga granulosa]SUX21778.1 Uncharacterised protein [Capnocytophaga granulosa]
MIQNAFPSHLHKDATKIADFLQQNDPKDFRTVGREDVSLNGEALELPQRAYFGEYNTQSLTLVQEQMLNCLYLCNCNGHLREHYLRELLIVKEDFTLLFIAKLLGDYVIEIVKVLQSELPNDTRDKLRYFFRANSLYQKRIESRIASYWDLFYRNTNPNFKKYIGYQLFQTIVK